MNSINITGNATKDAELKYIPNSGTAVLTFTLAVVRKLKNKDGSKETDFFEVVVWGKQAEGLSPYILKGQMYGVTGEMQSRTYENKSGQKVKTWAVKMDDLTFLSSKNDSPSGAKTSASKSYNHSQYGEDLVPIEDDGEIPF